MDAEAEKKMVTLLTNRFNRWWNNQRISTPDFKRRDFRYLIKKLDEPKAVTLIGPRQIGKTTVVMQIIRELIEKRNVNPKRILYAQFDDVELRLLSPDNLLLGVLEVYQKYVLMEDLNLAKSDVYLFFDEVQRVPDWAEQVKALHSANSRLRILATGSAGFSISQKSKETLPGRQELFTMYPLKFIDALCLYDSVVMETFGKERCARLDATGYELRAGFEEAVSKKSFSGFFEFCKGIYMETAPNESGINAALGRYFAKGGYPEIVITKDASACQKLLRSYANDVIVKDLMPWFKIRDFSTAEKLLFLLASVSGEQLNVNELLKRMPGSNLQTVNKYISYFESLNLLGRAPVYSGSKMGSAKHPKIYFFDVGLRNAILGTLDASIPDTEKGHIAETVAYDHIMRLAYKLNAASPGHVSCFQSKRGEVDFVLGLPRHSLKLPIEIKFRENVGNLKGMYEFLEITKGKMGIVVTENSLELKDGIMFIPLWMFLLLC